MKNIKKNQYGIYIIIEARSTSRRLKQKHLFKFQGISLIKLLVKKLKKIKYINGIILATTTNKIENELIKDLKSEKIKVFRGSELNVLERVVKAGKKYKVKAICRVTGDCPLIDIRFVQELVDTFIKKKYRKVDFISNSKGLPVGQGGSIIKLQILDKIYKSTDKVRHKEFITSYIWENKKKFNTIIIKPKKKFNFPKIRMCLDTKKDLNFIEKISKKYNLLNLKIEDILKFKKI